MSNDGKKVSVHYRGTLDDGTEFDSSYSRNVPLNFTCGAGQMIAGFDAAVKEMAVGDTVNVHLEPEEAYGQSNPELIQTIPVEYLPGIEKVPEGTQIMLQDPYGRPMPVTVVSVESKYVTLDMNHQMAGKALNFEITLLSAE